MERVLAGLAAVFLLLDLGCVRILAPGKTGSGALGELCELSSACLSGHCSDGVCCEESCSGASACDRPATPGRCVAREAGDRCHPGQANTCGGLQCVTEGGTSVCCNTRCQDSRASCHLPGHEGQCTNRALGNACSNDAECPLDGTAPGHCSDGVCCNAACLEHCVSCALPGHVGACSLIPDNTDVDLDCASPCQACFGGQCLPALVGTNPKGGCEDNLVCGRSGECNQPIGAPCQQDGGTPCAEGTCMLQACTKVVTESLSALLPSPLTTEVQPRDVAITRGGDLAVTWQERAEENGAASYTLTLARQVGTAWVTTLLSTEGDSVSSALAAAGNFQLLILAPSYDPYDCDTFPNHCSMVGTWVQSNGQLGASERLWEMPASVSGQGFSLTAGPICAITAQGVDDGSVLVAFALGSPGLPCWSAATTWNVYLLTRSPEGTWSGGVTRGKAPEQPPVVADSYGLVAVRMLAGAPLVVDLSREGRLRATRLGPDGPEVATTDASCDVSGSMAPQLAESVTAAQRIVVGTGCRNPGSQAALAFLDWNGTAMGWTLVSHPGFPNAVVERLVPLGSGGDTVRFLAQVALAGQTFGGYSSPQFSSDWVGFGGPNSARHISFPLVASISEHSHVLFASEQVSSSSEVVDRYPFAMRVTF